MSARPTFRMIDAATCPEGKLEVGGPGSRRGTVGRSRSMTNVVVTKIVTSITSAPTRNAMCAQWRPIARTTTATAAMPTTATLSTEHGTPLGDRVERGLALDEEPVVERVVPPSDKPVEQDLRQQKTERDQDRGHDDVAGGTDRDASDDRAPRPRAPGESVGQAAG